MKDHDPVCELRETAEWCDSIAAELQVISEYLAHAARGASVQSMGDRVKTVAAKVRGRASMIRVLIGPEPPAPR